MIDAAWLGHYGAGDAWEGGARHIRLWRDAGGTLRFDYRYESRSNHGYDLAEQSGVVVGVAPDAITVEVISGNASSWEDLFKEHRPAGARLRRRAALDRAAALTRWSQAPRHTDVGCAHLNVNVPVIFALRGGAVGVPNWRSIML